MGKVLVLKNKKNGRSFNANAGWREIEGKNIYFRSLWEIRYALYLQFLKNQNQIVDWEYEPQTFWFEAIKRGVRSYKPDFLVTNSDSSHHWVEVKGFMDNKSETKIKRFNKYYPGEKLVVVSKSWFIQNNCQLHMIENMGKKVIKFEINQEAVNEKR